MKTLLLIVLCLVVGGCATIHYRDLCGTEALSVAELATEPQGWRAVYQRISEGEEVLLHIPKGHTLPLRITMRLPMADVQVGKNEVVFTQDVYVLLGKAKARISPDRRQWADMGDMEAIKEVFDLGQGTLSVGLAATKEKGSFLSLEIGVAQR